MATVKDRDPATGNIRTLHTQPQVDSAAVREKQEGEPAVEPKRAAGTFAVLSVIGLAIAGFVLAAVFGVIGEPNRDPTAERLPGGASTAQQAPAGQAAPQR